MYACIIYTYAYTPINTTIQHTHIGGRASQHTIIQVHPYTRTRTHIHTGNHAHKHTHTYKHISNMQAYIHTHIRTHIQGRDMQAWAGQGIQEHTGPTKGRGLQYNTIQHNAMRTMAMQPIQGYATQGQHMAIHTITIQYSTMHIYTTQYRRARLASASHVNTAQGRPGQHNAIQKCTQCKQHKQTYIYATKYTHTGIHTGTHTLTHASIMAYLQQWIYT